MGSTSAPRESALYIRNWTKAQLKLNPNKAALARKLGVSRATIYAWESGDKGIGPENEQVFADMLFSGSVDALRQEARGGTPGSPTGVATTNAELRKAVDFVEGQLPSEFIQEYVQTVARDDPDARLQRDEYVADMRMKFRTKWKARSGTAPTPFDEPHRTRKRAQK